MVSLQQHHYSKTATRIITGHGGPVIDTENLRAYQAMRATVHERM